MLFVLTGRQNVPAAVDALQMNAAASGRQGVAFAALEAIFPDVALPTGWISVLKTMNATLEKDGTLRDAFVSNL